MELLVFALACLPDRGQGEVIDLRQTTCFTFLITSPKPRLAFTRITLKTKSWKKVLTQ